MKNLDDVKETSISELLDYLCEEKDEVKKPTISVTEDTLEDFLNGDYAQQVKAVQFLINSNLRNYIDILEMFFMKENCHPMLLSDVLEACIDQQIMHEFKINKNGYEMYFIPHYLEMPNDQDGVQEALEYLSRWFKTKEPIFYQMCEEMLLQEAYLQLPLMWEEGDGLEVALSIAKYVYQSWDRMNEFDLLCEKEDVKGIKLLDLMVETIEFE